MAKTKSWMTVSSEGLFRPGPFSFNVYWFGVPGRDNPSSGDLQADGLPQLLDRITQERALQFYRKTDINTINFLDVERQGKAIHALVLHVVTEKSEVTTFASTLSIYNATIMMMKARVEPWEGLSKVYDVELDAILITGEMSRDDAYFRDGKNTAQSSTWKSIR